MPKPLRRTYLLSPVLGIIALTTASTTAQAQSAFDGLWSVQIISQAGSCGQGSVTYPVRIVRGFVQNAGTMNAYVAGRVNRSGAVSVSVSSGGQQAHGSGRLSGYGGAGR